MQKEKSKEKVCPMRYGKGKTRKQYEVKRTKRLGPAWSRKITPRQQSNLSKRIPRRSGDGFEKEKLAFERLKQNCLRDKRFKGKFIAVLNGKIVDCDEDDRRLAKRVYDRHGYRTIFIGKVTEVQRTVEFPSPELAEK
jgi:hypothetical protein